jgi:hypothetical protein
MKNSRLSVSKVSVAVKSGANSTPVSENKNAQMPEAAERNRKSVTVAALSLIAHSLAADKFLFHL